LQQPEGASGDAADRAIGQAERTAAMTGSNRQATVGSGEGPPPTRQLVRWNGGSPGSSPYGEWLDPIPQRRGSGV